MTLSRSCRNLRKGILFSYKAWNRDLSQSLILRGGRLNNILMQSLQKKIELANHSLQVNCLFVYVNFYYSGRATSCERSTLLHDCPQNCWCFRRNCLGLRPLLTQELWDFLTLWLSLKLASWFTEVSESKGCSVSLTIKIIPHVNSTSHSLISHFEEIGMVWSLRL